MRRIGLIIALLVCGRPSLAQSLEGVWFGLTRAGLIQLAIDKDSMWVQRVTTDFQALSERAVAFPIKQIITLSDRQLLVFKQKNDTTTFSTFTVFDCVPGHHLQHGWNAPDVKSHSPALLAQVHKDDNRKLFGHYYFSARYINALHQLKPLDEMTRSEFDQFYAAFTEKYRQAAQELAEHEPDFAHKYVGELSTYLFSLLTWTLYEQGFNAIADGAVVQALSARFYTDRQWQKKMLAMPRP
jgi:hypothetical protein